IDDNRRAPAAMVAALGAPDLLPRLLMEGDQLGVFVSVTILNNQVIHHDGTRRRAPRAFKRPEVARPEMPAVNGINMQTSSTTKERRDDLAIGHATGRGPTVHDVARLRLTFPRGLLPKQLASRAVHAKHQSLLAFAELRCQKNPLTPNDWRRL